MQLPNAIHTKLARTHSSCYCCCYVTLISSLIISHTQISNNLFPCTVDCLRLTKLGVLMCLIAIAIAKQQQQQQQPAAFK